MSSPRLSRVSRPSPLRESSEAAHPKSPTRHSSRITEKQEHQSPKSPKSLKSPKSKPSTITDRPKSPSVERTSKQHVYRAVPYAISRKNTKKTACREFAILVVAILALVFALQQILSHLPFSTRWSSPKSSLDASFASAYDLTDATMSHTTSHCLDLALIHNAVTNPAAALQHAAAELPEGNTTLSRSIKAHALTYAAELSDAANAAQDLFASMLAVKTGVVPTLDHTLLELSKTPVLDDLKALPGVPRESADSLQRLLQPRSKARDAFAEHLQRLLSVIDDTYPKALVLDARLAETDRAWRDLPKLLDKRKQQMETETANLRAQQEKPTFLGFKAHLFAVFDHNRNARLASLAAEADALATFYNPTQNAVHPCAGEEEIREYGAREAIGSLLRQLRELRRDVVVAQRALEGRMPFWPGGAVEGDDDDRLVSVDSYVARLGVLRKTFGVEPAKGLKACREAYYREIRGCGAKKRPGQERARVEGGFPNAVGREESWVVPSWPLFFRNAWIA